MFAMENWLGSCAHIQQSWVLSKCDPPIVRYEDLIRDDVSIMRKVLIEMCGMDVSPIIVADAVEANRFFALTGGRNARVEDIEAPERKGIAGDWRNYFTENVSNGFNSRYGHIHALAGYNAS